jgi:hypothetical protein
MNLCLDVLYLLPCNAVAAAQVCLLCMWTCMWTLPPLLSAVLLQAVASDPSCFLSASLSALFVLLCARFSPRMFGWFGRLYVIMPCLWVAAFLLLGW